MKPKKRQKLCYHCEGEVDLDVIVCPFCAADLRAEKPEQQRASFSASAHSVKSLGAESSGYTPPPTFTPSIPPSSPTEELTMNSEESTVEKSEVKSTVIAVALVTLGSQLLLLAALLLAFGSDGVLMLKWDARLWFLYLFASVPLLLFGYRALARVSD